MKQFSILLLASVCLSLTFVGCSFLDRMGSSSTEQLLVAAGFQTRPVQTQEQKQVLASLTPYQVQMRTKGNTVYYIYPDPSRGFVLVGGPKQYQKFQNLSVQQGIAEDQMTAASEMQMLNDDEAAMWDPFWD